MDGKICFDCEKRLCEAEITMLMVGLYMSVPIYMPECVYDFVTPKVVQQEEV